MKRILTCMVIWLLGISNNYLLAQESKYQALYIFNFTKYLNWDSEKVIIGVMGNSQVLIELERLASQNAKVELLKISGAEAIDQCNMIFLPLAQTRNFDLIQAGIGDAPIVLVSEEESLINKGAEIAFYTENDRLKFVINKTAVEESGVQMSTRLASLGRIIR